MPGKWVLAVGWDPSWSCGSGPHVRGLSVEASPRLRGLPGSLVAGF